VLKGASIAAGGILWPHTLWSMFVPGQNGETPSLLAVPIRGLVKKDGRLLQPVQITLQHSGPAATAVTKLNGMEVDSRSLSDGQHVFQVFTAPVSTSQNATITVTTGDKTISAVVKLDPVHKVLIYILPHSHHDLGYTDVQANIEEKQMHNISLAIDLARKTANYPDGSRFVWNLEVLWSADMFMRRKTQTERDEFIDAVKKGWLSLNGMYANELTGLCRPEELLQLFRYSTELSKLCGVSINSAMLSDVPGFTWGTVTAMSQAGIRYFSAAPNNSDRIGTVRKVWYEKPFWWMSPSGNERVLVWMPGRGYTNAGANFGMVADYQERIDTDQFPYEIAYMRWSGHGDNAVPDPDLCDFIKGWNQDFEWPKFSISSVNEAFAAFEKRYGSAIPQFRGDLTPYWEDGAASSALETGINRNSADRLTQAMAMAAMLPTSKYRKAAFDEAWRNVLLYSEHTWGASNSVTDPENPMVSKQWAGKRQFALDAEKQSKDLLGEALRCYGTGTNVAEIDVLNNTSWARTEVVLLSKELSSVGDHVKDSEGRSRPSQRLSTGELAFLAQDVPAFGSTRFHLSAAKPHSPANPVSIKNGVLENGIIRARIDSETGNLVEFAMHGNAANLINTGSGEAANEYLFVEGSDFTKLQKERNYVVDFQGSDIGSIQKSDSARIQVEEAGPLIASLKIDSSAPGCNSLVRRVRLAAGADWIEISNVLDKKRAPLNPQPGNNNTGRAWAQYGGKESVQFAFPFSVPGGKMHIDIPLAEMQPEIDQIPGSNKNWLPVGRWIDVSNESQGVTWVTLDAPLVEVGEISATIPGSQHNNALWRQHIAPTQKFYSWVINNHWETNYRAYQEGVVEFRYALRANKGYNPAAASRFAIGLSQPLVASVANSKAPLSPLLHIEPSDVLALTLKPSDDGDAWIIRLFGASGEDRKARLHWSAPTPPRLWLSDLSERPIRTLVDEITVAGWDLVTLRADRMG